MGLIIPPGDLPAGGASAAEDLSFDPAGSISSTTVQTAIEEVASESGISIATARQGVFYPPLTIVAGDDEFADESFTGFTAVADSSPVVVATELNDSLSLYNPGGDSAAEMHAYVKALATTIGSYVEICVDNPVPRQDYNIVGLLFASGTTYGAGTQSAFYWSPTEESFTFGGDFTNYSTAGSLDSMGTAPRTGPVFLRWKYSGANAFEGYVSPDGISWVLLETAKSRTLAPAVAGFFVTTWGGALPCVTNIKYCRYVTI